MPLANMPQSLEQQFLLIAVEFIPLSPKFLLVDEEINPSIESGYVHSGSPVLKNSDQICRCIPQVLPHALPTGHAEVNYM